jgi:hypothetical protein
MEASIRALSCAFSRGGGGSGAPLVRVEERPGRGRALVAARALPPGTLVLAAAFAAAVPTDFSARCALCFGAGEADAPTALSRCGGCKTVRYCSPACQRADWPDHRAECAAWKSWLPRLDAADATSALLLGRLVRGRRLASPAAAAAAAAAAAESGPGGDVPAASAEAESGAGGEFPAPLPRRRGVYVHCAADVARLAPGSSAPAERERAARLVREGAAAGLFRTASAAGDASAPRGLDAKDAASLTAALLAFDANNFLIADDVLAGRAAAVSPAGAILNHSCAPNCVVLSLSPTEAEAMLREAAEEGGGSAGLGAGSDEAASGGFPEAALAPPARAALTRSVLRAAAAASAQSAAPPTGPASAPSVHVFRTLRAVAEGEELAHSYVDLALPREARRA